MAKTIIVAGYGVGISKAVAEKFAAEGFAVALVARNAERLAAGVKELEAKSAKAVAIPADLGDASAVKAVVDKARTLGPIAAIHWNAYSGDAGNLLEADTAALHRAYDVSICGLLAAIQASLADLKAQKGSVLVTNGGFGLFDANLDAMAAKSNNMGLSMMNAAKHKMVGMLAAKLAAENVYVGEVMVMGMVKGTAWDSGNATIDPKTIAAKFWDIHTSRKDTYASVS